MKGGTMVYHVISDFPTDLRVNGRMSEQVSERISIAECVSETSSALLRKFVYATDGHNLIWRCENTSKKQI